MGTHLPRESSIVASMDHRQSVLTDNSEADDGAAGQPRRRCRVVGLKSRADLNGALAHVVRFVETKQRWALVTCESSEKLLIKEENIEWISSSEAASGGADAAGSEAAAAANMRESAPSPRSVLG